MNVSNLDVCCLAYDKQFDQLKAKIDADPECVKKKDRVCRFVFYLSNCYKIKYHFRMVVLSFIGLVQVVRKILFNIYLTFVMFDRISRMK